MERSTLPRELSIRSPAKWCAIADGTGNRRLIVAASEQGFLPRFFANFNERQKTPINGILLSSALSTVFICLGDFSNLTLFYGVRDCCCSCLRFSPRACC
jgi:L-asparagine transporter-like permease